MAITTRQQAAMQAFDAPQAHSEGFQKIAAYLSAKVTRETVLRACTNQGKIRASKPKDGVFAYIWRWARFHNGADPCMPCTIEFDLDGQLERDGVGVILGTKMTVSREEARFVQDMLEVWSDWLIIQTGGNPMAGARRWAPLLGLQAGGVL
jgi:hypothetical protein